MKGLLILSIFLPLITFANESQKDDESKCWKEDGKACFRAGSKLMEKGERSSETMLGHGCKIKNADSCKALDSIIKGYKKECAENKGSNYISCGSAGYFLNLQGKASDAIEMYQKACSAPENVRFKIYRSCKELASLITEKKQIDALIESCNLSGSWSCVALGHHYRNAHDISNAIKFFKKGCDANDMTGESCEAAARTTKAPHDVEDYYAQAEMCSHWREEEPYNEERAKEINEGVKDECKDQKKILKVLKQKYKNDPEVLFKLNYAAKLFE